MVKESIRLAVLSDIHGNTWALEAVLADIKKRDVGLLVNLGDCVYGPLDPGGTAELLMGQKITTVLGNQDRISSKPLDGNITSPTLTFVLSSLTEKHHKWLESLQPYLILQDELVLCHGTPSSDTEYMLEEVSEKSVCLRKPEDLEKDWTSSGQHVLLCGHSHVPHGVSLVSGRLIINPGSVGLPAYTDDWPFPHAMETGSPHARYTLLQGSGTNWTWENIAVPYDWDTAAEAAIRHDRPDWAQWIRTGRARV